MIKKILEFLGRCLKKTWDTVVGFVKETIANAPAATILVTSSIGICGLLTRTPLEKLCVPIPWLNEAMVCMVLAVMITYTLAMIAQHWSFEY